jgi:hypothetical protein
MDIAVRIVLGTTKSLHKIESEALNATGRFGSKAAG